MVNFTLDPKISENDKVFNSDFTIGWILDSLMTKDKVFKEKFDDKRYILKSFEDKDISGGKGMFSTVIKIWLHMENEKGDEQIYTTILKIPCADEWKNTGNDTLIEGKSTVDSIVQMHDVECQFYEIIGSLIPEVLPRVYELIRWEPEKHQGCILMEDLSVKGRIMDYHRGMNLGQLKNVIQWVALFHAKQLVDKNVWKDKFVLQKKVFSALTPMVVEMSKEFCDIIRKSKSDFIHFFENEKIQKILNSQKFVDYVYFESLDDLKLPILLAHSDIHTQNMIFEVDENGEFTNRISAILDWQIACEGNWLLDFVRLMMCNLDGDVRREAESFIFDFYVEKLDSYLEELGHEKSGFTGNQVKEAYDFMFLAHFGHSSLIPVALFKARGKNLDEDKTEAARFDRCTLRAIHVYEDALRLLDSGKYDKWL